MHAVLFPLIGENCLTELQIVAHSSEGHVLRMGAKPVGGFFLFQMLRRLGGIHTPTVLTVFTMTCAGLLKMFPSMYVTIFLAPSDESQHSPARRCLDDTIRGGESQAFAEIPLIFLPSCIRHPLCAHFQPLHLTTILTTVLAQFRSSAPILMAKIRLFSSSKIQSKIPGSLALPGDFLLYARQESNL